MEKWVDDILSVKDISWTDQDGSSVVLNGFIGVRIYAGLPVEDKNAEKHLKDYYKKLESEPDSAYTVPVDALNLKQIREKTVKVDTGRYVQLGPVNLYDPGYLSTLRRALPDANWYIIPGMGRRSPLYAISNTGKGLVMPKLVQGVNI